MSSGERRFEAQLKQTFVRNCCLIWLALQMFKKMFEANENRQCQEHITYDLTLPSPINYFLIIASFSHSHVVT